MAASMITRVDLSLAFLEAVRIGGALQVPDNVPAEERFAFLTFRMIWQRWRCVPVFPNYRGKIS